MDVLHEWPHKKIYIVTGCGKDVVNRMALAVRVDSTACFRAPACRQTLSWPFCNLHDDFDHAV